MEKGYTELEKHQVHYEWTIKDFSLLLKMYKEESHSKTILSPTFASGGNNEYEWQLKLSLNENKNNRQDWMGCYLTLLSNYNLEPRVQEEYFILNNQGIKISIHKSSDVIKYTTKIHSWGYKELYSKAYLSANATELLPNDNLTICCDFTVYGDLRNSTSKSKIVVPPLEICNDYEKLYKSKEDVDFTFIVRERQFHVHKTVLIARSAVFSAMLQHHMRERQENQTIVTDVDPHVFKQLLLFIYTDKLPQNLSQDIAIKLLAAADKYGLQRLKNWCEEILHHCITVYNALKLLIYADRHSAQQLLQCVIEFFRQHSRELINTKEFQSMAKSYPHLPLLLLRQLGPAIMNPYYSYSHYNT